jgi:hypothetical protein
MTEAKDWNDFLEATAADPTPATFPLTPDESVEDPEAHVQKVPFHKTAAALWVMVTGGGVGFILLIYGLASYVGNTRKVIAVAPPSVDPFQEKTQESGFLPKAEESPSMPVASKPPATKVVAGRQRVAPSRVVYMPARNYSPTPRYTPIARYNQPPARPLALRPVAPPATPQPKIEPLPEPISALYAAGTEEGPQVEAEVATLDTTTSDTVTTASKNSSVNEAIAIYDGIEKPVTVAVAQKDAKAPLTAEEYAQAYPKEVEKESQQRLIARLAMIPAETTIKGQTMALLSWNTSESFPVGDEIRIQVKSDYKQGGETVIPKGSVAIAQAEKGTTGQYIMANVTRIETPEGRNFSIKPGMLTASTGDGFISAKIKEPKQGGGAGRVLSRLLRSTINIGVATALPQGDGFSDRVIQNTAAEGLDSLDNAFEPSQRSRGRAPSFYYLKPKTSIALVANGDIELTEAGR